MSEQIFWKVGNYFNAFEIGVYSEEKNALFALPGDARKIKYLRALNAKGNHIFCRPLQELAERYLLLDDLSRAQLERDHQEGGQWKPGRMCVETSPQNFQVWLHFGHDVSLDEKRSLVRIFGADAGADPRGRWGRCPSFRNRKEKHRTPDGYPLSKLVWVDWVKTVTLVPVNHSSDDQGKAHPEKVSNQVTHQSSRVSNHSYRITREEYESGGDESKTDFRYVLALLRRGFNDQEITRRLRSERTNWENHKGTEDRYINRTIAKARCYL